jgi:hypothetical protein
LSSDSRSVAERVGVKKLRNEDLILLFGASSRHIYHSASVNPFFEQNLRPNKYLQRQGVDKYFTYG